MDYEKKIEKLTKQVNKLKEKNKKLNDSINMQNEMIFELLERIRKSENDGQHS